MDNTAERRTITVGNGLAEFIQAGGVKGKTVSGRIERMAARYAAMVQDLIPTRWTVNDFVLLVEIAQSIELSFPGDASMVAVRLRRLAKDREVSTAEYSALAFRVENLRLAEQIAVIDLAERAIAAGATTRAELVGWLQGQKVSFTG